MKFSTSWQLHCEASETVKNDAECMIVSETELSKQECIDTAKKMGWVFVGRERRAYCPNCKIAVS